MKNGKERPRANSFDEQFFNNILDKDDEIEQLNENDMLPAIHNVLANKFV